jgi:Prokaryotic E2 family E
MRRQFALPEQDVDHLTALGLRWETLLEGSIQWLIVHDFPIPEGYNLDHVTVALMIQPGYPVVQIDMAYFYPHLQLKCQKGIGAITFQSIEGKIFQRWSRHRAAMVVWIEREVPK